MNQLFADLEENSDEGDIRDPHEYQTERLREARHQYLISLALSSSQRPQLWQWANNKKKKSKLSQIQNGSN